MKKLLFMMLLCPIFISAQEYGDTNVAKKIIVARFETPFKMMCLHNLDRKWQMLGIT